MQGRAASPVGRRMAAVVPALFDREGRLAFRCAELASASDIARAMRELAALDSRGRR